MLRPPGAAAPSDVPAHRRVVPEGFLLTTRALGYRYLDDSDGCREEEHRHDEHTVLWPERGIADVRVSGRTWRLALGQGLWVPAGTPHAADRDANSTLWASYILSEAWPREVGSVGPVVVNAALRHLLIHLAATAMPREQRLRAQAVCMDLVTAETRPTVQLPLPRDPRIASIAAAIMRDPADDRSIEQWAALTAQSARTIARGFRAETGLTFSQWRTAARLARAAQLLDEGLPVGVVARRVGYATNSAFTAAFKRVMRETPREFAPSGTS
ncbi:MULTISPECIES: helix-turn-helix domain-containing protein [unclassified Leucobacter]|uniref:helix-turn-helix domain-containing protein n=1 Tax=unclassified Leucobacter TaxID=2621730 RepID=UPI00062117FE|nr:AraC family transcriptional regulator [Leucobacter sp. Ag1]KKI21279.1 hypothetical protein XM48_05515 [Leucobacter sp. Ag1]